MSAFSVTAIDRMIEPAQRGSLTRSASMDTESLPSATDRRPPFSFYPPLYATPSPQRPPSPSPSSFSPSPYVLNHKRRGPAQNGALDSRTGTAIQSSTSNTPTAGNGKESRELMLGNSLPHKTLEKETQNGVHANGFHSDEGTEQGHGESEVFEIEIIPGDVTKLTIRDTKEAPSTSFGNPVAQSEGAHVASSTLPLTGEEFYDAPDAPLDDSASEDEGSLSRSRCSPLKSNEKLAVRLQDEVVRRVKAEEALALLQLRWNDMAKRCSSIGFSLSRAGDSLGTVQGTADPSNVLSEKLLVARMVGGAIASATVRAEKDEELENVIAAKNREISRLWDKLQYYELVNREMSQRNQEAIESAQRRKRRRRKRQKWVLGGFCAVLCVGSAGLLCYKLVPWEQTKTWAKSLGEPPSVSEPSVD